VPKRFDPARMPPAVTMTLALWFAVFLLLTLRSVVLTPETVSSQFAPRLVTSVLGAVMCGGMAAASWPIRRLGLAWQLAIGLVASVVVAFVYSIFVDWLFSVMTPSEADDMGWFYKIFGRAQFNMFIFMSWCFAFLAVRYSESARRNELELAQAQALAADAQNRMLRYQINPHFLFNTLNALQTLLLERKVAQSRGVVEKLAEFLRYSLSRKPDEMVSLREEVEAQQAYLSIEEVRFSDRLTFEREIDPAVEAVPVPSLILQPLIENAVKYAVGPAAGPVLIRLAAYPEGGSLVLEVRDDGETAPKTAGLGVGLDNIHRRLALIYGERASFEHGPVAPRGYRARVSLPLEG
jgi:two-component system LytT family sensor kinase